MERGGLRRLRLGAHDGREATRSAISPSRMTGSGLDGDFGGTFPFEARYIQVADDVRMHYVDEGPSDARPLLFVHGNPTWSYLWRKPIAALAGNGRRCVAFDHMGFGRSDKPPQLYRYTLQTPREQRRRADRRARPARRDARGARLGRPDRPRSDAGAKRPAARRGARQHMGLGAAELRALVHPRAARRGPRRAPRPRRQPLRRVDPRRHGPARSGPRDDGGVPRPVPGLLVADRRCSRRSATSPSPSATGARR